MQDVLILVVGIIVIHMALRPNVSKMMAPLVIAAGGAVTVVAFAVFVIAQANQLAG